MKACEKCAQMNPDEALVCGQCATPLVTETVAPESDETRVWRSFIGPQKAIVFSFKRGWSWERPDDYYLQQFKKFTTGPTSRFSLTWHWPAFLVDPFLWFLYRKMYLYALIYALGPVLSAYLTGDFTVGFVWRVMAGVSANYISLLAHQRASHRDSQGTPTRSRRIGRTTPGSRGRANLCPLAWGRALHHALFDRSPSHSRRSYPDRPRATRQGEAHGCADDVIASAISAYAGCLIGNATSAIPTIPETTRSLADRRWWRIRGEPSSVRVGYRCGANFFATTT